MGGLLRKRLKKGVIPRFNLPNNVSDDELNNIIKSEVHLPETNVLTQIDESITVKTEPILPEVDIHSTIEENVVVKSELDLPEFNIRSPNKDNFIIKKEPDLPETNTTCQIEENIVVKVEPVSLETNRVEKNIIIKTAPNTEEKKGLRYPYNLDSQVQGKKLRQLLTPNNTNNSSTGSQNSTCSASSADLNSSSDTNNDDVETILVSRGTQMKQVLKSNFGVQAKPRFRSKATMCKVSKRDIGTNSPQFEPKRKKPKILISDEEWLSETSDSETEEVRIEILKDGIFETRTKAFIEHNPLLFLGVPKNSMKVVYDMQKALNIPIKHIYCVLKKIRMNLPNEALSYDFGLSYSQITQIFKKDVPLIADFLKGHIFWPDEDVISENLPMHFKNRLKKVQSILEIFEIKFESSTYMRGLRPPSYESTDTAKFLISSTPNGFINFVSTRYTKRYSDASIVETSGFLDVLPEEIAVLALADRGFKYVDTMLRSRNCSLIRLPSISLRKNMKLETKSSRWLASVRIHVKRIMNQLRDFKILENSINLGKRSESLLDDIIVIAAALNNLQLLVSDTVYID